MGILVYFSRPAPGSASEDPPEGVLEGFGHHFRRIFYTFFKYFARPFPDAGCMQDVEVCILYGVRRWHAAWRLRYVISIMISIIPYACRSHPAWLSSCMEHLCTVTSGVTSPSKLPVLRDSLASFSPGPGPGHVCVDIHSHDLAQHGPCLASFSPAVPGLSQSPGLSVQGAGRRAREVVVVEEPRPWACKGGREGQGCPAPGGGKGAKCPEPEARAMPMGPWFDGHWAHQQPRGPWLGLFRSSWLGKSRDPGPLHMWSLDPVPLGPSCEGGVAPFIPCYDRIYPFVYLLYPGRTKNDLQH